MLCIRELPTLEKGRETLQNEASQPLRQKETKNIKPYHTGGGNSNNMHAVLFFKVLR